MLQCGLIRSRYCLMSIVRSLCAFQLCRVLVQTVGRFCCKAKTVKTHPGEEILAILFENAAEIIYLSEMII
jgi:hypothetical protein